MGLYTDPTGLIFPVGNMCEKGGYCPTGSKFPLPCDPGYYNPVISMISSTTCLPCTAGNYCNGSPDLTRTDLPGAASPNNALAQFIPNFVVTGPCLAGYYCISAAYHPK